MAKKQGRPKLTAEEKAKRAARSHRVNEMFQKGEKLAVGKCKSKGTSHGPMVKVVTDCVIKRHVKAKKK